MIVTGAMASLLIAGSAFAAELDLENEESRVGYSLGYNLGQNLKAEMPKLSLDAIQAGFSAAYSDAEPKLDDEAMKKTLMDYQKKMIQEQIAKREAAVKENEEKSKTFLEETAKKEGIQKTESGLLYEVITEGKGDKPTADDTVEVNYTGTLPDGTEFDSNAKSGKPIKFGLKNVIKGWTEGVQLMTPGSKYRFYIPAELAYGKSGAGRKIGPNQALVFEVELVSVASADKPTAPKAEEKPAEKVEAAKTEAKQEEKKEEAKAE